MFSMHDFLMDGLRKAVNEQSDSWTTDRAKAWFNEKWLTMEDLAEIDRLIKAKYPEPITETEGEPAAAEVPV